MAVGSLTLCVLALTMTSPATALARHARRPNVLVIVTDDQRARGTLSVMPRTRRLFRRGGIRFGAAFAASNGCCPSRASLMTGRYPHNHEVVTNQDVRRLDHDTTLQSYLQGAGYTTAIVGKYLNKWPSHRAPPYFDRSATYSLSTRRYYYGGVWEMDGDPRIVHTYSTSFIRRRARRDLTYFERNDRRPWLLYVAPFAAHSPYTPEPAFARADVPRFRSNPAVMENDRSDKPDYVEDSTLDRRRVKSVRRRQLRTLMSVDDLVGRLFRTLQELKEGRRTLAIFTSDSGFLWGEHALLSKSSPYTDASRIPLYMRWPGHIAKGIRDRRLVSNVDVAPTVLAAARITPVPNAPMDGRSLLSNGRLHRAVLMNNPARGAKTLRTGTFQYTEYGDIEGNIVESEYYDLVSDSWQLRNRLGDARPGNDPDVARLQAALSEAAACSGSSCP